MNRVIKGSMDVSRMDLEGFGVYMSGVSRRAQRETEAAWLEETNGLSLHEDYMHLKIRDLDFYGSTTPVTSSMRTAQLEKIHKAKLIVPTTIPVLEEAVVPDR